MRNMVLVLLSLISISIFANDHQQRRDAALAAIGAFVVDKHEEKFSKDFIVSNKLDVSQIEAKVNLFNYYGSNYETRFNLVANSKETKKLIEIGKKYIEKIIQQLAKPVCTKYKICSLKCYTDVLGDVIDMLLSAAPELFPVKAALQTYIIDGGMEYLSRICRC